MRIRLLVREMTLLLALLSAALSMGQDVETLLLEKEIVLPGAEGRIDHFSVDVPGQRLFVAALENGSVEIIDTRQGERTAEIKGLEEPQGVYYSSKTGGLYVATGRDGKLRVYDGKFSFANYPMALDDADKRRLA
jgi:YVTN family beta-propeller protein